MSYYMLAFQNTYAQTIYPKDYKLFVNLENAPFDSLFLQDYTSGRNIIIRGKKIAEFLWQITIPERVVSKAETMQLLACPFDPKSTSQRLIRFLSKGSQPNSQRNGFVINVGVDDRNNYIFGRYLDNTLIRNGGFKAKIDNKDSTITGNIICENFELIIKDENSDMAVRAQDPFFSLFMNSENKSNSYESQLSSYISLAKKHPSSRFLISNLSDNLNLYKSKGDVEKVYLNFSNKYKNSVFSKKIESFIYRTIFPNKSLPTTEKTYQKIIQDSSKYNLIVFTASWCEPCVKEIPLLKKIYKDLGKDLQITYISIDNKQGVPNFEKLIKHQKIPWRTLFAYNNLEENKRTYFVETIPHIILVYPSQTYKIIDVRKEYERSKLYSIVKSVNN